MKFFLIGVVVIFVLAWMTGYLDEVFHVSLWILSVLFFIGIFMNTKDGDGPPSGRPGDQY